MSKTLAKGAVWMVLFKLTERSLGLISTLILARLLVPRDFGIVAMAASLIALLELISAFGLDTALLQRSSSEARHYNTAWSMNALAGCTVGALMAAAAIPASHFYHEPALTLVVCAVGLSSALQGFENVGVVAFRKELRFDLEFRYLLTKKLINFGVTIPLAFALRNYWALVLGLIISRVLILGFSFIAHPFRPRFSLAAMPELMHFSKWMMVQNSLAFLRERSADFIVGYTAGPATLGTFSVASQLASMPSTELVAPINRAILPTYMLMADDVAALARKYLSVMSGIAMLAVPAVAGLAATAPFVILLALGPKWRDAIPVLEVLAFFGITQVLQTNAYSAFLALGKPEVFARINGFHVVALLISLLALAPSFGILGVAYAYVLSALLALPVNFWFITRFLNLRVADLINSVWRPMASSGVMFMVVRYLGPAAPGDIQSSLEVMLPLAECLALGVLTYGMCTLAFWWLSGRPAGAETWLANEIANRWQVLRSRLRR